MQVDLSNLERTMAEKVFYLVGWDTLICQGCCAGVSQAMQMQFLTESSFSLVYFEQLGNVPWAVVERLWF